MQPTSNDVSFNFFGFRTAIQPFFWLIAAIITASSLGNIGDMQIWIVQMLLGIAGVLISILVHELGHALTFRYVFRTPCAIVLHGFGGMAIPLQHYSRSYGFTGAIANCFLSFSGPLAGFVLAFVMFVFLQMIPAQEGLASMLFMFFLRWTAWISIFWGIFNLLPIYPMDGGHISREIFLFFFPRRGAEFSLLLSMFLAVLLAVAALQYGMFFITFLFAYFAYQNYQEMTLSSFRRWNTSAKKIIVVCCLYDVCEIFMSFMIQFTTKNTEDTKNKSSHFGTLRHDFENSFFEKNKKFSKIFQKNSWLLLQDFKNCVLYYINESELLRKCSCHSVDEKDFHHKIIFIKQTW